MTENGGVQNLIGAEDVDVIGAGVDQIGAGVDQCGAGLDPAGC